MDLTIDGISPTSSSSSHHQQPKETRTPEDEQQPAPKKQRRRAAATDAKKHICPEPGCEKAFSRPDHLSRHRLNHNPVTTYHCSYAPCPKTFVRLDLLVRHEERHLRKVDPEKAAEHRARTAKAQAQAQAQAQASVAAAAAGAAAGGSQTTPTGGDGSEHGSPFSFGTALPPLAAPPLPNDQLSTDQHQAYQQRIYSMPQAFSPSTFSTNVNPAPPSTFNGFSPATPHANPADLYAHHQQQQHQDLYGSSFRPDASTSGSTASAIPPNHSHSHAHATADLFLPHTSHQSDLLTTSTSSSSYPPPAHSSFDPSPPPPVQLTSLDLVQASLHGAPFVSASEYDWLFDPSGGFDISFPQSRPASPFGAGGGGGWGSGSGGLGGMTGLSGMEMSFGGLGTKGFQSAMGMGALGMGGMGLNEISGLGQQQVTPGAEEGSPSSHQQQQQQQHQGQTNENGAGGAMSPGVSRQLEAATRDLGGFAQHQQQMQQMASSSHGTGAFEWGAIVEEEEPASATTEVNVLEHQHSAAKEVQQAVESPHLHQTSSLPSTTQHSPSIVDPAPTPAPAPAPTPAPAPAPPAPAPTVETRTSPAAKKKEKSKSVGKEKEKEKLSTSASTSASATKKQGSSSASDSAESATLTAATSVPTPYDTTHDVSVFIDNDTRMRVIDYCGPSWQNLRGDTRMTRGAMMEYMDLFWTRVHETQAPAVHRASFKASTAPTPLLLSMMLLGCYFSSLEAYKLACQLHSGFRGKVLCSNDFRPRAELWLHQTILLIVIFGKLCSTRMDHEMSHIFWSSCVTLGRRSAIFSQRAPAVFAPGHDDIETQWAAWIEEEVAKRIALIIFGVDVEHAAFFRHSPTLSAFQIQLQLPCDEELWEARDAQEWARLRVNARPPIPFISALKASLMAGHAPPALNPFSRIAILHGLLSVAQDLQWRDHVIGMSQPEGRANNWRDMISASYNSWKSRLDTCLVTATFPTSQLLRASISLYAIAHITLSIDIHELQIYAGAESALGLVVSAAIYNATEARIKMWSQTKDARAAVWHAAFFLRSSLQHYQQSTVDLAGCLHHRWSVFIATLTLYCYGRSTSGEPGPRSDNYQDGAMRYLDTMCTNSPEGLLAVEGKNNTLDLCQTICEYVQASRWEIAQEGARILRVLLTKNPSPPNA